MKANYRSGLKQVILSFIFLSVIIMAACDDTYEQEPIVNTFQVADSNVTATSAKVKGQIQLLGTQQIIEYGIELYKGGITNLVDHKGFNNAATTDTFTVVFTGLDPSTLYYYWAYATVNTTRVHSQTVPHFTTKSQ
ncbi:MAG: hypothetical protein ABR974_10960 [Bacteroidales bacterium]|jgi:hypothetical protein